MQNNIFEGIYEEIFPFWRKISDADREYICQNSHMITYPKGKNIHNGEECSGVILVRSGCLRLSIMSDEGKTSRFTVCTKGIYACCLLPVYCPLSHLMCL